MQLAAEPAELRLRELEARRAPAAPAAQATRGLSHRLKLLKLLPQQLLLARQALVVSVAQGILQL